MLILLKRPYLGTVIVEKTTLKAQNAKAIPRV